MNLQEAIRVIRNPSMSIGANISDAENFILSAVADGTLLPAQNKTYVIGDRTMARVFEATGLTNISDIQTVMDAVEKALENRAEDEVRNEVIDYIAKYIDDRDGERAFRGLADEIRFMAGKI